MIMLSFITAFSGFVFLSMAMKRHFKQVFPNGLLGTNKVIIFRLLGTVLLIGSAIVSQGTGIGLVYWCGLLTFAALLQSMLLSYQAIQISYSNKLEYGMGVLPFLCLFLLLICPFL